MRADYFNQENDDERGWEPDLDECEGPLPINSMKRMLSVFETLCTVFDDDSAWHCVPGSRRFVHTHASFEAQITWDHEEERWLAQAEWTEESDDGEGLRIFSDVRLSVSDPTVEKVASELRERTRHLPEPDPAPEPDYDDLMADL